MALAPSPIPNTILADSFYLQCVCKMFFLSLIALSLTQLPGTI